MQWIDPFTQQVLSHNQYTELFPKQDIPTPLLEFLEKVGWLPAVVTGACICHFTLSQIFYESTKIS